MVVCNPITGETLQLPKAPPLPAGDPQLSHLFVLGFSATTKEYKMFRVSFPRRHASRDETNYIAVYTLGGGGGWRQCSYLSRCHPLQLPAPVNIDGNIFVPTADLADKRARAARMLVVTPSPSPCRGAPGLTTPRRYATGLEILCTSMTREDTHRPPTLILSCLTSDWISQMLLGIRHCLLIGWSFAGGASAEVIAPACSPLSSLHCHHPKSKRGRNDHSSNTPCYVL